MATLAQITHETRIILKLLAVSAIIVSSVFLAIWTVNVSKKVLFPAPPPGPEMKFGALPPFFLPQGKSSSGIQFSVNTIEGTLPPVPDRMRVYKIFKSEPNILSLQNIKNRLKKFGFSDQETKITDTMYQWTQEETGSVIKYDLLTNNFEVTSSFISSGREGELQSLPRYEETILFPLQFLKELGIDTSNIDQSRSTLQYLALSGTNLSETTSASQAKIAKIQLYQKSLPVDPFLLGLAQYESLNIFYPTYPESSLNFLVANTQTGLKIIEAKFFYNIPSTTEYSTYPLKGIDEMYQDLQVGKGYIIAAPNSKFVEIIELEPGYYLSDKEQFYITPILIFKGKDFVAFVSALEEPSVGN